jgi:DNA-binding transcriptional MerR regulator
MEKALPAIPAKRYFTIGEVSELCQVKPYVLRYWEQEFTQLKPMKRRGNRRYYQHHEVLLVRRIRDLLYDQGFTISGARNRLADAAMGARAVPAEADARPGEPLDVVAQAGDAPPQRPAPQAAPIDSTYLRAELTSIRDLLTAASPETSGRIV